MADLSRRRLLQASMLASGAMLLPGVMQAAWAAGSDKPEQDTVRIGFIPLTDCAPVVIAALKGFDKKHGITIVPTKEASWAAVRDKLVAGELDAAHILYGLLYGLELGIAGKPQQMANLMTLNQNGQAITLSSDLAERGVRDLDGLKKLIAQQAPGTYTFAHTFPTGTHAMWLYYWLASAGINPFDDVRTVVVPPPQMVMNMRIGNMVNCKEQYLTGRMLGEYDNGVGQRWQDAHPIRFFNEGAVSYPYLSDGMWFLTQFRRWGLLNAAPDYAGIAQRINQTAVWQDAATAVGGMSTPSSPYRSSTLMDGTVWNGTDPEGYANRFAIHRKGA